MLVAVVVAVMQPMQSTHAHESSVKRQQSDGSMKAEVCGAVQLVAEVWEHNLSSTSDPCCRYLF